MNQIPNEKGAKLAVNGVEYTLHRPGSPVEGFPGRENLAIWKDEDGDCYMLSLEGTEMIQLPDCGE